LKVYYRNFTLTGFEYGFEDTSEILLYDFALGLGDSILNFNMASYPESYLVVQNIDTVIINSVPLKRWEFYSTGAYMMNGLQWIEGIGSDIGFFTFKFYFENSFHLCNFHANGQNYFDAGIGISCPNLSVLDESDEYSFEVFPNPSNGQIFLSINLNLPVTYNIVDITGRYLQSGQLLTSPTEVRIKEKGLYNLMLSLKDGITINKKIVVQ
jgi:hypothetical protein